MSENVKINSVGYDILSILDRIWWSVFFCERKFSENPQFLLILSFVKDLQTPH